MGKQTSVVFSFQRDTCGIVSGENIIDHSKSQTNLVSRGGETSHFLMSGKEFAATGGKSFVFIWVVPWHLDYIKVEISRQGDNDWHIVGTAKLFVNLNFMCQVFQPMTFSVGDLTLQSPQSAYTFKCSVLVLHHLKNQILCFGSENWVTVLIDHLSVGLTWPVLWNLGFVGLFRALSFLFQFSLLIRHLGQERLTLGLRFLLDCRLEGILLV